MKCRIFALTVVVLASMVSAQTFGQFGTHNFVNDTVTISYKLSAPCTSAIVGMSSKHPSGPDLALWGTLFYKITPDSTDSISVSDCLLRLQEVDFWNGETVYTVCADTGVDSITTTGVAADSSWTKKAFAPDPADGYRIIANGVNSCSASMESTLKVWFHLRKKIGIF